MTPYLVLVSMPILHFTGASSRLMNEWVFRHSARSFPLNYSMKLLFVGLPPREKSRMRSRSRGMNSEHLFAHGLWVIEELSDPLQSLHHIPDNETRIDGR